MLDQNIYPKFKPYHQDSTFAIWADSKQLNTDQNISYQNAIDAGELNNIKFDRLILTCNPSREVADHDFSTHHGHNFQSRQMRYILKTQPELHKLYYGAFCTDVFPKIIDHDAKHMLNNLTHQDKHTAFDDLLDKLIILVTNTTSHDIHILVNGTYTKNKSKNSTQVKFTKIIENFANYLDANSLFVPALQNHTYYFEGCYQFSLQGHKLTQVGDDLNNSRFTITTVKL